MWWLMLALFVVGSLEGGWKVGLTAAGFLFFFTMFLGLLKEMHLMFKYKHEFIACTDAVMSNNEEAVDQVNRWTTHYYVHESFHMSASKGKLDCGYKYSVRDRPRDPWGGAGGGDIGFISFG